MKNITRLLFCTLMALTFVFSTMLQFHHHDSTGNIFIYIAGIGEIELSSHFHHFGETCCCHSHSGDTDITHSHNSENIPLQSDCPMHLDETIVIDDHIHDFNLKAPAFHLIQAILPVVLPLDFQSEEFLPGLQFYLEDPGSLKLTDFSKIISHRGPPQFVS